MKQLLTAMTLLMCCLTLSACETMRTAADNRPDQENPDRLICIAVHDSAGRPNARPQIPEAYVIDWERVVSVGQARSEHEAYVTRMNDRNGRVTGYIVKIEAKLFTCSSNAKWWRDYWSNLPN